MAKRKINKSEKIRETMKANPTAGPTEITMILAKQRITVTPAQVSNIKTKLAGGGAKTKGKRGRPKGKAPEALHGALDHAFEFVERVGGLSMAEKLIDKLKAFKARL